MEAKKEIRRTTLSRRDALPPEERKACDKKIQEQVLRLPCYQEASAILAYVSYRSEVDTRGLMERALADGKQVFAPKVEGKEMEFWRIDSLKELHSGYRGIPEPAQTLSYPAYRAAESGQGKEGTALMWIPGAAFDRACRRIGYGGGYYDRYLARLSRNEGAARSGGAKALTAIALAYDCQLWERIPEEPCDYRPDFVLTEYGLIGHNEEKTGRRDGSKWNI
ncbi:MAG: 5-formyltetrahydrofolate cyclo-ligase [Clostridiales bacterium]|nr:5-formyltetrahydrofolate cyclo-ligase [Clostridiales bacterium]